MPDIDQLSNIRKHESEIQELYSKIQQTVDGLHREFKIIGVDVKEVYIQLEAAFGRTQRERANHLLHMNKIDEKLKLMYNKQNKIVERTSKLDRFVEEMI